jgi:3-oxoacyl-[acyl-carrier protein] reductase
VEKLDSLLKGRVALVTGGSRNLGAEIVERLVKAGARVALTYLSQSAAAQDLQTRLETNESILRAYPSDLCAASISHLATRVREDFGPVDILVHNAGPYSSTRFLDLAEQEWDCIMNTNLKAAYLLAREFGPGMKAGGWGRIVFLGAVSAYRAESGVYGLAKSSLAWLCRSLATELAPQVTVNIVEPGQVEESVPELEQDEPGLAERLLRLTPLARFATRSEIASLIIALCSPPYDSVTGIRLPVDGGASINPLPA